MTVTIDQIASEISTITPNTNGWDALTKITKILLHGTPDRIFLVPTEKQVGISEWADKFNVVFKNLPVPDDESATVVIETDQYYWKGFTKVDVVGANAVFTLDFKMSVTTVGTRIKTEWKQIDDETRKLVKVLDATGQPVIEKLPPDRKTSTATGEMLVPLSFFVDLLNEIGRDSLITEAGENYIPAVLGEALANVLGAAGVQQQMLIPQKMTYTMGRGNLNPDDHRHAMMMSFLHQTKPTRIFIQPDDKGRMEVVAEPYSDEEIKNNYEERGTRALWAKWSVSNTETVKAYTEHTRNGFH